MPAVLVLDNNVYTYAKIEKIAALHARGHVLRVSDIAFSEGLARSVREYEEARLSRERARGKFFERARTLKPYIDPVTPVAASGGQLARLIIAEVDGLPPDPEDVRYRTHFTEAWEERVTGIGMTDEEWITAGHVAEEHLAGLDRNMFELARPEEELRENPLPADVSPAEHAASQALWDTLSDEQRFAATREYMTRTWGMSPAVAERFDAHAAVTARRLHEAAHHQRQTARNDGADAALTMHVAEGCILVTQERRLIKLVDRSKTYQAPWVRHIDDLDALPEGMPWGESARQQAATFQRRPIQVLGARGPLHVVE